MLPGVTVAEILGECAVNGAAEALKHMFRIARDGMGSVSLMLLHLGPTRRAPSMPDVTGQAWEGLLGSKAERRVLAAVDPAHPQKRVRHTKDETSLNVKLTEEMQKAIDNCFRVLNEPGYASPRYTRVKNPVKGQEESVMKLQTNAFIHNFSSPKGLNAARRKFETCLLAMRGGEPFGPRGVDSGRLHHGAGTAWSKLPTEGGSVFGVGGTCVFAQLGIGVPSCPGTEIFVDPRCRNRARKPAKTASPEMVRQMGNLLFDPESHMLRCWAGAQCQLHMGGPSGHQKPEVDQGFRVRGQLACEGQEDPCAMGCAEGGFTGRDWGSAWLSELAVGAVPGEDFILKAPNSSWTSFANRIADFSDGQADMRALLVKAGMTVKSVMEYSCHSWRHF